MDLTWSASLDNVGVTGYRVYRGGQQIASRGATTSYTDTSRPPGTYSYTVRAEDAAGNVSDAQPRRRAQACPTPRSPPLRRT